MNDGNMPLLLRPSGKDYLWGGSRLNDEFEKGINLSPVAETWECSTHPDGPSYVVGGEFAGMKLAEVLRNHPEYLGERHRGMTELPILIKFIDAKKDLSVQVHAPISGGTPAAEAGTLAIMAGGDKEVFEAVRDILCMVGTPVYVGPCGSGSITKLVNNIIAGMNMLVIAEAYALGEKAGMDLPTIFEATRGGYAGGPVYENKVPKLIRRDYQPGARIAVHRKDIINAKKFAEKLDVSLPVTDVLLQIMDWMMENGYGNEDQIAMVKYYENSMKIKIGNE